jgi:RHS repeat-associated protein
MREYRAVPYVLLVGAVVLVGSVLAVPPAGATAGPAPKAAEAVVARQGAGVPVEPRVADPEAAAALRTAPAVTWPAAGVASVTVAARSRALAAEPPELMRAGKLPVRVGSAGTAADTVQVEVLDRAATERAGVRGMLLRVGHPDGAARKTTVEVDYSGFRQAYGGDYGSRLTLRRLSDGTAVPARNNVRAGTVTAEVTDGLYAVTAAASGSAGSFQPTSLAPSATWQAGLQSGDFQWSYPITVPPMPGPTPEVELSYSSGVVDGRIASTNNQASWIGEGFDYQPGYIERSYQSCDKDGRAGVNDLCWASYNATVVLPGLTGELVRDDNSTLWRAERDGGWRVELLTGAPNGAKDGEYWRLTGPDGTQYFFGRHRLPEWQSGNPETNSTLTVPVFGNQDTEPCHGATFETSWCQQAYRWNLDFVVDRHGDVTSYFYDRETNHYARNAATPTAYTRAGYLSRIEYGQRLGSVYSLPAPGRVVFTTADRCIPGSACVQSQPRDWPDVPWDQWCGAASCMVPSPTFWTTKGLAKITTQVLGSGGTYQDVDSHALAHSYPMPGGGTASPSLWLDSITHTGQLGDSAFSLPPVTFDGEELENRVDAPDMWGAMYKRRLRQIYTETGGQISVNYAVQQCSRTALPQPDANQSQCFPAFWGENTTEDWFHKYVVTQVTETDRVGGNEPKITSYEYVMDGPGWHHDDAELVPENRKTWGQFRGFQLVRVRTGTTGVPKSLTEHLFLRGMDGDVNRSGGPDDVTVDGVEDRPAWRGFVRMTTVYDGDGGARVSSTVAQPAQIGAATARRWRGSSGWLEAYVTDVEWRRDATALAGGGTRTTDVSYLHDPGYGTVRQIHDKGDVGTPDDDTCTDITYARNDIDWIVDTVAREITVGAPCGTTPSYPTDLIADQRTSYDGLAFGAAPTAGDVTRREEAGSWSDRPVYVTTQRTVVDGHGRPVQAYDSSGHLTATAYTPASGGPLTRTVVTDPKGFTTTKNLDARGNSTSTIDANGGTTTMTYDALGRLARVWLPGRTTSQSPNTEYTYTVRADGPSAVATRQVITGTTAVTSYELFDGMLRPRQTQRPAPGGGRIVTDTLYDSHGRLERTSEPRHDPGFPGTTLLALPMPAAVPGQKIYLYDGAGRTTAEIFLGNGVEKWRTSTTYGGNRTSVDPPDGDTATTKLVDARGQTTELRQYHGGSPTGGYDATHYTYTKAGDLSTVRDAAGNVWRYSYDLRRRRTVAQAPDTGTTTSSYDDEGRLISTTDARGQALTYTYDVLDRRTAMYAGTTSGTKLAEWTYDTAPLGKRFPATSVRYAGGSPYGTAVIGYDARGRRTGESVTVPAVEEGLVGTYTTRFQYNEMDQVTATGQPAAGGLPSESLLHGYDTLGQPSTLRSTAATYVSAAAYTPLGEPDVYTFGAAGAQLTRDLSYEQGTGRLTGVLTTAGSTVLGRTTYGYDPAGTVTRIADEAVGDTQCLRYDYLRRLVDGWTPAAGDCATAPTSQALGGPAAYWHSYTYDATGNRVSEVRHATGGDTLRSYGYPAAGAAQPHTLRTVTASGSGAGPGETYGYDAAGNTTSRAIGSASQALTWDAEGHLAQVAAGGGSTSYLYDADGERLIRRDSTGTTLYLGETELRLAGGTVTGTRYYRFGGATIAVRTASGLTWLAADQDGTTGLAVTASSLAPIRRYDLPFGGPRGAAPTGWPSERGFVGGTYDGSTGLTHLGAREYDPATGRFVSVDPVVDHSDPQQVNAYAYANNSPVTFSDADGRQYKPITKSNGKLDLVEATLNRILVAKPSEDFYFVDYVNYYASDVYCDYDCYMGIEPFNINNRGQSSTASSSSSSFSDRYSHSSTSSASQSWPRPCRGWNQCIAPRPDERSGGTGSSGATGGVGGIVNSPISERPVLDPATGTAIPGQSSKWQQVPGRPGVWEADQPGRPGSLEPRGGRPGMWQPEHGHGSHGRHAARWQYSHWPQPR